ncbi:MAG: hydroxysqualene dehydroxylase HpnE [Gaiellaceae bacterium]
MRAVVVGGGLAGLAAALDLVDAGHDVTLLESRPALGGAVHTLPEREGDPRPPPDNGQHIALGCFDEYLRFLDRIGESGSVRRMRLTLPVLDERGRIASIGQGPGGLLRYGHLPLRDRIGVLRTLLRLRSVDAAGVTGALEPLLRRLGSSQLAIDRFWDVFVRPALNLPAKEVSAAAGVFTVQTALLGPRANSDLVLPAKPLGEMHGVAAGRALEAAGACVQTGVRVAGLEESAAVLADGERVEADAFVLAVPPADSARLLGEPDHGLEDSPIVSVHLLFDRPLLRMPLAALLRSPAHWVFDRGFLTGYPPESGQYLTVVSSGVPDLLEVRGRRLVDLMASELTNRLGRAEVLWSRVSREPRATIALRDGHPARPAVPTARPNVTRAGAWTDTGWPATMEGAVRSGRAAATCLEAAPSSRVPA